MALPKQVSEHNTSPAMQDYATIAQPAIVPDDRSMQ
jgi:hypothetical protein